MKIYHYDRTGKFVGESNARPNPRESGKFLIPANASVDAPPREVLTGAEPGYFIDGAWTKAKPSVKPDDKLSGLPKNEAKKQALIRQLEKIDSEVEALRNKTFPYNGNNFYPDGEFITGKVLSLQYKPDDYSVQWKTADSPDGINNVFVTLDKDGIAALGLAYEKHIEDSWTAGEIKKQQLKALYNDKGKDHKDIMSFNTSLN